MFHKHFFGLLHTLSTGGRDFDWYWVWDGSLKYNGAISLVKLKQLILINNIEHFTVLIFLVKLNKVPCQG